MNSILVSIGLGAIWGAVAATANGQGTFAFAGAMIGGIVGVPLSPACVYSALRSGLVFTAIVIGPINILVVLIVSGLGSFAGPLLALLASAIVYVCLALYLGKLNLRQRYTNIIGACPCCGYTYLSHENVKACPDCDEPRPPKLPAPICDRCGYSFAGLDTDICPECGSSDSPSAAAAT